MNRSLHLAAGRLFFFAATYACAVRAGAAEPLTLEKVQAAFAQGRFADARTLATSLIKAGNTSPELYALRAASCSAEGDHASALADYDELVKHLPKSATVLDARGSEHFMLGQFDESIADFDRAIELQPNLERGHWKRGISYYYAGRYADGQKQFEGYQQVDGNDVENAVWRFLCMVRDGGLEKAQADILPIRNDGRVPMMQIYSLYAGEGTEKDVLDAVAAGEPAPPNLNARQFYAELYLGLYAEATGDPAAARRHLDAAVKHRIGHYMWDVARVHADLLRKAAETGKN
jgi:lipoprotein NlpI